VRPLEQRIATLMLAQHVNAAVHGTWVSAPRPPGTSTEHSGAADAVKDDFASSSSRWVFG